MYFPCTALVTVTVTPCETSPREAQDPLRARHTVGLKRLRITDDSTALISGRAHNHTHMHCQHNTCHITNKQRLALANAHLFSASQRTNQCNQLPPHAPLIDPRRLSNTIPAVALNWINQNKIGCMRSRHSLLNKKASDSLFSEHSAMGAKINLATEGAHRRGLPPSEDVKRSIRARLVFR